MIICIRTIKFLQGPAGVVVHGRVSAEELRDGRIQVAPPEDNDSNDNNKKKNSNSNNNDDNNDNNNNNNSINNQKWHIPPPEEGEALLGRRDVVAVGAVHDRQTDLPEAVAGLGEAGEAALVQVASEEAGVAVEPPRVLPYCYYQHCYYY